MITIYPLLVEYSKERNLPPPSSHTLHKLGKSLSQRFLDFIFKQDLPVGTLIEDAGFLVQDELGKKFIVKAYPDAFKSEMLTEFDYYYLNKNKPQIKPEPSTKQVSPEPSKKQRKRIPIVTQKVTKEWSERPGEQVGQNQGQP